MATSPKITEADIRQLSTAQSYARGEEYYRKGAVFDPARRGDTLTARVEGSQYEPYRVTIKLDEAGVLAACSMQPQGRSG